MQRPSLWAPSLSFSQWVPSLKIDSDPETGQRGHGVFAFVFAETAFSLLIHSPLNCFDFVDFSNASVKTEGDHVIQFEEGFLGFSSGRSVPGSPLSPEKTSTVCYLRLPCPRDIVLSSHTHIFAGQVYLAATLT